MALNGSFERSPGFGFFNKISVRRLKLKRRDVDWSAIGFSRVVFADHSVVALANVGIPLAHRSFSEGGLVVDCELWIVIVYRRLWIVDRGS